MKFELEPYQHKIVDDCRETFVKKHKHIFVQAPTRSGKTVIFTDIGYKYITSSKKDLLILVHDMKILRQIKKTFYQWHEVVCEEVNAKVKTLSLSSLFGGGPRAPKVIICMVETLNNRMKLATFREEMKNVGLIIADEAHLSNFKKIYLHPMFEDLLRIGFSATPLCADKKDHLYPRYFTSIVVGPSVKQLIEVNKLKKNRGVVKCATYVIDKDGLDKSQLKLGIDGDYDVDDLGDKTSGRRQLKNTVNAYATKAFGKKVIVFNSNKKHSKLVCAEFVASGFNARHIDSDLDEDEILRSLKWFEKTPGAILCNVRMTTTGFDEPSCEGTLMNTLTKSISLDKQMRARSGTPYQYPDGSFKELHFTLDMYNNTELHGEWSDDVDWEKIFYEPKYAVPGPAPKKECKACGAMNAASATICVVCDEPFPRAEVTYDNVERGMKLYTKDIDIDKTISFFSGRGEYTAMFDIIRQTAWLARRDRGYVDGDEFEYLLDDEEFNEIFKSAQESIRDWRKAMGKESIAISFDSIKYSMREKLEMYGFILPEEEGSITATKNSKNQLK